jgi:RimJ/RimL family protein N-acetyltransferase
MSVHLTVSDRGHQLSGVVRAGESWRAAARRTCASLHVEPRAFDLSGEVKRFVVDHERIVGLRAMTRADLADVARWRGAEHVRRWWPDSAPPTLERVTERYGPRIDGTVPTRMWVVEVNGRSVGFCQDYRIRDHPDFAVLAPDPDAVGVDYVVGEAHLVGIGVGTALLWAWLLGARRRYRDVATFFAAPDHRNAASLRVLAKVGFEEGTWFDEPQADGEVTTMVGCSLDAGQVLA